MADDEYPEWLKDLAAPVNTFEELERMGVANMDEQQRKRFWRVYKRNKLRMRNEAARVMM